MAHSPSSLSAFLQLDKEPSARSLRLRLGVALACVLLGWLARKTLTPFIGDAALPFIFFFPAVTGAALYGGLVPALLCLGLSALVANVSFVEPVKTLSISNPYDVAAFLAFLIACSFIILPIEALHRARARLTRENAQRRRAESELAAARDWLATTLTSIGDGVIATDADGRVTLLNAEAERLTGWTSAEAAGRSLSDIFRIVKEDTRQPVENPVDKVLRLGKVQGLANHTILIAKDGAEWPIDDSAAPIRGDDGRLIGVVLVFRDVTEQRLAQRTSARLAAIVEYSGDAILAKGLDGTIRSWNTAAQRLFGYTPDEIIGKPVTTLIPQDRIQEEDEIVERIRLGQPFERLETQRLSRDGRRVPVSLTVSPIKDPEGRVIGASKILRDISDLVAAREALAREKELLAVTLASIGDGVVTTDVEGRVTFLNAEAERLTGWATDLAQGRPLPEVFHIVNEQTRQPVENPVDKVLRLGQVVGLANHTILIARDGTETPIDDSAAPIQHPGGPLHGVVLVFRDFTLRRQAEHNLTQAEEKFRSVVNHIIDGIISIDEAGMIQSFNPAAERLFGYERSEVLGQNVLMLMPPPYRAEHDGYLANYRRTGQAKIIGIGREVEGRRKNGSTFPMDLAVSEFRLGQNRLFTGIVRDITDRKRAENALREADQRKDHFLAILSHELRNPLASIRMAVTLLRKLGPPEPALQDLSDTIDRQSIQLTRLLDDLLDVSRIASGKFVLRKEPVSLGLAVAIAAESVQPMIDSHSQELSVQVPPDGLFVNGDLTRLAQVIANLLNNAAKYADKPGRITLSAQREGNDAVIRVRDTGIGIAADQLPRIFDMFTQVDQSPERREGGLGVGLSLVKKLIELHGGSVSARSDGLGKGSEFTFRLPAIAAPPLPSVPPIVEPAASSRPRRKILVADDNVDSATLLTKYLDLRGHDVRRAFDGAAAIDEALAFRPDVIILDIGMPEMSGYDVARRIRTEFGEGVTLFALTGWGQEEDKRRAEESGFDQHLTKPVDLAALDNLLNRLAQRQRA